MRKETVLRIVRAIGTTWTETRRTLRTAIIGFQCSRNSSLVGDSLVRICLEGTWCDEKPLGVSPRERCLCPKSAASIITRYNPMINHSTTDRRRRKARQTHFDCLSKFQSSNRHAKFKHLKIHHNTHPTTSPPHHRHRLYLHPTFQYSPHIHQVSH